MGLEVTTYVSGLTATWPEASDRKSQGDDHLRLIKSVLQNTFPNAAKPFYFPSVEEYAISAVLDATDHNNVIELDTGVTNLNVTLPSTLTAADKGWQCTIIKVSTDANAILVAPTAGTILTKVGTVASVRVGILCEPATFVWNGTSWRCFKPGPMIGSSEEFNGATLPPGYLWDNGQSFSATLYAELYKALGSSITATYDKRGRVSATLDNLGGAAAGRIVNNLTNGVPGTTLGGGGGLDRHTLIEAQIPTITPQGNITAFSVSVTINGGAGLPYETLAPVVTGGPAKNYYHQTGLSGSAAIVGSGSANFSGLAFGGGQAHNIMQPTIMVSRMIRAC